MATRKQVKMTSSERRRRRFSENFKIQKVKEIERGQTKISELSREYEVTTTNIHRWIHKYGTMKDKPERMVVETQSDTKQLLALKKQVAELERIIGQKQILIDFKEKMIELAEEEYGIEIKKKYSTKPSDTFGKDGKNTLSV